MEVYRKEDEKLWFQLSKNEITLDELRTLRPCNTFHHFGKTFTFQEGERFYQQMFEHLIEKIHIDKDVLRLLEKLSKKYSLYLLTNGISLEQRAKIEMLNIAPFFKEIYISEEIDMEKPDVAFFKHVLENENLQARDCLMIGDSYTNDIAPAEELGFQVIHVDSLGVVERLEEFV